MKLEELSKIKLTNVLYLGIELSPASKDQLELIFGKKTSDHVTIAFGEQITAHQMIWICGMSNVVITFTAEQIGENEKTVAIFLDNFDVTVPFDKSIRPHITIEVKEGGKPKDSNKIRKFKKLEQRIHLSGKTKIWTK